MITFYTIGYEGLIVEALIAILQQHAVERVIDVRRLPLSRKPGFSKTRLAAALAEAAIGYSHLVGLGTPRDLLAEVRKSHNYPAFFAAVAAHLDGQQDALSAAEALVRQQRCVLLCVEASPDYCHRRAVAEKLIARAPGELAVVHLNAAPGLPQPQPDRLPSAGC